MPASDVARVVTDAFVRPGGREVGERRLLFLNPIPPGRDSRPAIESAVMHPSPRIVSSSISAVNSLLLCLVLLPASFAEETERPRITGIDHVTIYITDIKKSLHFYEHILGLTPGCPDYSGRETCFPYLPSTHR